MKGPSVTVLKKYLNAMSKNKVKYMTCERLSRIVGVYPEVIAENLSYFDPMLNMDPSYDLLALIPQIKEYINNEEERKHQVLLKWWRQEKMSSNMSPLVILSIERWLSPEWWIETSFLMKKT